MEGHRQRLIESGLLVPLSNEEIARRNGIIVQIAERKARGDKCRGVDIVTKMIGVSFSFPAAAIVWLVYEVIAVVIKIIIHKRS